MSINYERAFLLLSVIKEAIGHGPAFVDLIAEAGNELNQINTVAHKDGEARAAEKAKADAQAKVDAEPQVAPVVLTSAEPEPEYDLDDSVPERRI